MRDGFVCYRSQGGTQWHVPDAHGFAWCGLPPGSLALREGKLWTQTPDQDRCQTCHRLAPMDFEFIRWRGGKALSERVVENPRPRRARRTDGSWAWPDPGTTLRQYWGELGKGTPKPRRPVSYPVERQRPGATT